MVRTHPFAAVVFGVVDLAPFCLAPEFVVKRGKPRKQLGSTSDHFAGLLFSLFDLVREVASTAIFSSSVFLSPSVFLSFC